MNSTDERFNQGAPAYAAYLETVEGRLRLDVAWAHLRAVLHETGLQAASPAGIAVEAMPRALDLGGGTGTFAVRLAQAGWRVAVVDASSAMLELAARAGEAAGVGTQLTFHRSDAANARELFPAQTFAVAVCHNVLEYVDDPAATVQALSYLLRPRGLVSLVARNRAGEAMRAALKAHDLELAARMLDADDATESLYGGPARLFDAASLTSLAQQASLTVVAARGVRVFADYLPAALSATAEGYAELLHTECHFGARPDFAAVARYTQLIARA